MKPKCSKMIQTTGIAMAASLFIATSARADIYEWEYINPAVPGLGKQQGTTLVPDGSGASAVQGATLSYRDLTKAYLIGADLSVYYDWENDLYYPSLLIESNLSQSDLSDANLRGAVLTRSNLSQANLTHADFGLYGYFGVDLIGANLAQVNATDATFFGAALNGAKLSQANLMNANFSWASLNGADLTGAEVRGASFENTGIVAAQIYSTASYVARDLTGINLGFNALAGADFTGQNLTDSVFAHATLTHADFHQANLTNANLESSGAYPTDLTGANFSHTNLTNATFFESTLTDADLTNADVRGANFFKFFYGTGITLSQLYSTASYQGHDLSGIVLVGHDLTGVDLVGQNLTNANFYLATLTGADLTWAVVRGANFLPFQQESGITLAQLYSTASYQAHDLSGINLGNNALIGADLAGQNLSNASFAGTTLVDADLRQANLTNANLNFATLTGADLTGAIVRGADFQFGDDVAGGISLSQLYSTASYQARDLTGITLGRSDFSGADFAGQVLHYASFITTNLTGADLSQSDLRSVHFYAANLTDANLSGADARGANFQYGTLTGADTTNLIQSNGHIAGLNLTSGASLIVRDYDGDSVDFLPIGPRPIAVEQSLIMDATGTLRLVFDADEWDSTISFAPGIPVALGGTLELTFAAGVDVSAQLGRSIDVFDWFGVVPTGAFSINSPYPWDATELYSTGHITLIGVPEPIGLTALPIALLAAATAQRRGARGRRRITRDPEGNDQ